MTVITIPAREPALTATEAWCADSILALDLPTADLARAIAAAYGSSVNHERIIAEVTRRRSEP